jgi:polysaccharide pyruvyl transferase WcaK-like protein
MGPIEDRVHPLRAHQICNGLGAGNIGDELMARAFWDALPSGLRLIVDVFPNHTQQREPYPERHEYVALDWDGGPVTPARAMPGLLVGDTPVTESLSLDWPLRFLAPRLRAFHEAGQPVDAVGVGVEPLRSPEAREIFARDFRPIRSWTVRSVACRGALLDLGVDEGRVEVGADWAWLYRPRRDLAAWGALTWARLGLDPGAPLLVANVVNERWRGRSEIKAAIAAALDELAGRHGFQVAFFCNEVREGEFYDLAAARETQVLMKTRSIVVPHLYWAPDEVLGLLSHAAVTLGGRYHFIVESVLAGVPPVGVVRSEKVRGLFDELGLEPAGTVDALESGRVVDHALAAVRDRDTVTTRLAAARERLAARAALNLRLVQRYWREGG